MTVDPHLHPHGPLVYEASECARPDLLDTAVPSRPARRRGLPLLRRRPGTRGPGRPRRGAAVLTLVTLCAAVASFVAWIF